MSGLSKGFPDPSIASTSQECQAGVEKGRLRVTLLSSEWRSSTDGDVSTINRELAIQLAKHPSVQVSVLLPQCSEEDKRIAAYHNVHLIEAEKIPGMDPVDCLFNIPENHAMDCVIGHGVRLGRQVPVIKRQYQHCKWIQVVHTAPEELGMYKSISEGEQMQRTEIKLCEKADHVVAVGPKLADAYKRYLRSLKKDQDVFNLTPSIFTEFSDVQQATEERETFCVLAIGSGESEDFSLKGYDLAAQAIAELKDQSYQLRFICAPTGKGDETAEKLLQHGIGRNQLIVRRFHESREVLARLFCEVDLAIMPSRTEGFGLIALEALSAGLPVLVSGNSGLGKALKKVPHGSNCIVNSEDPKDWAKAIRAVRDKDRDVRLAETKHLCKNYLEKYNWQEPCDFLVKKMQDLVFGSSAQGRQLLSVQYNQPPFPAVTESPSQMYQTSHTQIDSLQTMQTSTEKDKRPSSLHSTQPSKRLREELTDQYHQEGSSGSLPSSVEHSQWPSNVTSQTPEGSSDQRSHIQSSSGQGRWPLPSVQYNQPSFPTVAQYSFHMNQTSQSSHIQGSSGHGCPPSVQYMYNQLPFTSSTQSQTPVDQTCHTQSPPRSLPPEYCQSPATVASHTNEGHNHQRRQTQGFFGYGLQPPSVINCSQLPFTQTQEEPSYLRSHIQGHGLSAFLRILKFEYNRRSLLKPLLWENTFKLPLEEVYTRLSIVSRRKTDFQRESNEVKMYDVFTTLKKGEDAMVLVEGSPGIGKTTFCLKIAHDWTNEKIPREFLFRCLNLCYY